MGKLRNFFKYRKINGVPYSGTLYNLINVGVLESSRTLVDYGVLYFARDWGSTNLNYLNVLVSVFKTVL